MAESRIHIQLVEALVLKIKTDYLNDDALMVFADTPDSKANEKPPLIGRYRPDVYVRFLNRDFTVIGEAKTKNDVECWHTYNQMEAFLRQCGQASESVLVIAVPWYMTRAAKSMVTNIGKKCGCQNVRVDIIEGLKG